MNQWCDLQVNGYAGVDFNQDDLGDEDFHRAMEALAASGTTILATIISETPVRMCQRVRRLAKLRNADPLARQVIAGIHIEGPFLNPLPGFCGAHPIDALCFADERLASQFVEAAAGLLRIFTLAPEVDIDQRVTRRLAQQGVTVSAGHTNASTAELRAAIEAGLSMFTHLGNGCPHELPRHDNIIQRVLALRNVLWIGFIGDGVHVPYFALRNYLDLCLPMKRCFIVSDAMPAAGKGPGRYATGRYQIEVGDDLIARASVGGHLVGSAVPLPLAAERLQAAGFAQSVTRELFSLAPRRAIDV